MALCETMNCWRVFLWVVPEGGASAGIWHEGAVYCTNLGPEHELGAQNA